MLDQSNDDAAFAALWQHACLHQIKRTKSALAGECAPERAVQQARSGMKRTRALLLLAHATLGKRTAKRLDKKLAGLARKLSGTRDPEAMLEALDKCLAAPLPETQTRALSELRASIEIAQRKMQDTAITDFTRIPIQTSVDTIRREIKAHRPQELTAAEAAKSAGLTYGEARKAMRKALEIDTGDAYHQWRKVAQRHLRHLEIFLAAGRPDLLSRVEATREIVQLLGDDHDLSLIQALVAGQPTGPLGRAVEAEAQAFIVARQKQIRTSVGSLAGSVFGLRRKELRHMLLTAARNPD